MTITNIDKLNRDDFMIYIYNDYVGTHSTSLVAAYHLKQLTQSEKTLTAEEILNVQYFNKLTKNDFEKLILRGSDEEGNSVFSITRKKEQTCC